MCLADGVHPADAAGAPSLVPDHWPSQLAPEAVTGVFIVGVQLCQYLPLPTSFGIASTSIHCFRVLVLSSVTQY